MCCAGNVNGGSLWTFLLFQWQMVLRCLEARLREQASDTPTTSSNSQQRALVSAYKGGVWSSDVSLYDILRNSLLVRAPDSWSKGCEFKFWQGRQENFLLQSQLCVLTLIWWPLRPHVTVVACKRPWSFCQKCRWQVTSEHVNTLDPTKLEWADYAVVHA